MRGLQARVEFAKAAVLLTIDSEKGNDAMLEAFFTAEREGFHDYKAGRYEVPTLLRDEPDLVGGWVVGQSNAAEFEIMSKCFGCHDGTGNPCRVHG